MNTRTLQSAPRTSSAVPRRRPSPATSETSSGERAGLADGAQAAAPSARADVMTRPPRAVRPCIIPYAASEGRMRAVISLTLALAAGCSGPPGLSPAALPYQQPAVPWARMTAQQKQDYMRSTVMPEMRALFVRFDPHRYPKMGCSPCHMRTTGSPDYRMPNLDLPLDPSTCAEGPGTDP